MGNLSSVPSTQFNHKAAAQMQCEEDESIQCLSWGGEEPPPPNSEKTATAANRSQVRQAA